MTNNNVYAPDCRKQAVQCFVCAVHESRPQQQILRRVSGQGKFGKKDNRSAITARRFDAIHGQLEVVGYRPDTKILLR